MRATLFAVPLLLASLAPSPASAHGDVAVSVGVALPGLSVALAAPGAFAPVPGVPVLYAPRADANLFLVDGRYWSFAGDRWWSCAHRGAPWVEVAPAYVPPAIWRVPVGYYRRPPAWFGGWHAGHAPRWGEHWGRGWEARREVRWDHGDHRGGGRGHDDRWARGEDRDRRDDRGRGRDGGHERGGHGRGHER